MTTSVPAAQRSVAGVAESADGTRIAVYEQGNPDGPTVVLVHGWPDSHVLWDGVVPLLAERFRIIRYDNRGVGGSAAPKKISAYTMAHFADDFAAVIGSPGHPVHVLAHDWGSVGVWEYLSRAGVGDRVASFTSVSGPSVDHLADYIISGLRRPYRPRTFGRALSQAMRLSYQGAFSVPVLAPLVIRAAFAAGLMRRALLADGIPPSHIHHADTFVADAAASMKVYPANYFRSFTRARHDHYVGVPVQLIVNTADPYVRPHGYDATARWVGRLWRRDHFTDTLVSVTGAASGIGRATALAFAAEGAEVVVSDVNEAAVKDTAAQIAARGGAAHAYVLDVADAEAVEAFAEQVCTAHGVPDIVVNNAGIGQAGSFLDTPAEQFDRLLDVNFGGVVNGCRAFARRLVDRGVGGHIVNVASMAAYAPLQSMNAYSTAKAAVYMFSDCLRAELDSAGIGLTTICPGVIDTNIVHTTRFDAPPGKAEQVDGRRAQLEKIFAMRRYGPDKVAKAIVSAVNKNKPIRPVAPEAYLLYAASRLAPQVLRSTARGTVL